MGVGVSQQVSSSYPLFLDFSEFGVETLSRSSKGTWQKGTECCTRQFLLIFSNWSWYWSLGTQNIEVLPSDYWQSFHSNDMITICHTWMLGTLSMMYVIPTQNPGILDVFCFFFLFSCSLRRRVPGFLTTHLLLGFDGSFPLLFKFLPLPSWYFLPEQKYLWCQLNMWKVWMPFISLYQLHKQNYMISWVKS